MNPMPAELFTAAEYRAMPPGRPYYQLVEGELIRVVQPNSFHQTILGNVAVLMMSHVRAQRLGTVCMGPLDAYLSDITVLQPDVFFLSTENLGLLRDDGVHGAPDLVVEIVSPSNGRLEMKRKRPLYAQHGVREEWLIEPELEQIHRYDFMTDVAKPVRVIDSHETFETPLLPGLVLSAADIFRRWGS